MRNFIVALCRSSLFRALIISIVLTVIICLFVNMLVMPFWRKRFLELAKKEGRVVVAKHKKTIIRNDESPSYYVGIFEYEYKGKKYKYRANYYDVPSEETLYFRKSPSKAKTQSGFGYIETEWKYVFIVCFIVSWLAMLI